MIGSRGIGKGYGTIRQLSKSMIKGTSEIRNK